MLYNIIKYLERVKYYDNAVGIFIAKKKRKNALLNVALFAAILRLKALC